MSSQRSAKPTKPPNQTTPSRSSSASSSSSVSSHLAMIELKQRILTSLSKLADRDTHQIAVEDLEKIIQSLSNDGVSMLLNCLYDAVNDPKPAVKKEGIRFLAALCAAHTDPAATHLTKIIAHIVKRLKDSDSQVRDACRDAIGTLAGLYLKGGNGGDGVVSLFVKPLFEVMSENNKTAQCGASMCLAKMVECASDPPLATFQKLCPRVCKFLNNPNFFAKASLLQVVSSLSQVGAISPQNLEPLLQRIHECLGSSDWATRKAAADALSSLASNVSNITPEGATSTLTVLEACRFDKAWILCLSADLILAIKFLLTHMISSLILNPSDGEASEPAGSSDRKDLPNLGEKGSEKSEKNSSSGSPPTDSNAKGKGNNISDEAVGMLRKKVPPALTDKELNPEFFHKLETRGSGDLPVEVVVPRRYANPSDSQNEEDPDSNDTDPSRTMLNGQAQGYESIKKGTIGDRIDPNQREFSGIYADFSRNESDGLVNNKGNWLAIQRQLLQLERQQAHLMNMLQDFMGGSHDSMVTLESRVRGLERVVEDMARDLSISTGMRGRGPSWRSDASDAWDFHPYSKNGQMGSRRTAGAGTMDIRSSKSDNEADQVGSRRAWEKGGGPVRFGEGPSARSVWQASKDEATLEAIRVAGEDNGVARNARVAIPEMTAEALGENGNSTRA
ncbi:UNVERIFIED_CONTAM: Microtubule-associated protein TORTIFOLIA1 [Sesamum latifolium]|uniref:Microtubule-associated protein TORTIFOLIA1 n=1 Tax=Sesamum latifolium TaxID=2727402 RepID=A0AAW2WPE1_9LAMI